MRAQLPRQTELFADVAFPISDVDAPLWAGQQFRGLAHVL